jgi:hypothetical protein
LENVFIDRINTIKVYDLIIDYIYS